MTAIVSQTDPRQRLLEAAEGVFARKGFDGATVREICDRAGMNVAAINYHFGDKERLYIEAVKFAHICSGKGVSPPPDFPADMPPADKLRHLIRGMAESMHVPVRPASMQLLMREMAHPSAAGQAVVTEFIQPMAFCLRAVVRELMPGLDENQMYMVGLSVIGQLLFYRQNRPVTELIFGRAVMDALTVDMVADHITRFTLAALGHGEPYRMNGGGAT